MSYPLDADQRASVAACLRAADNRRSPDKAKQCLIVLGLGENNLHSYGCNSSNHCGYFQLAASWQAMHDYRDVEYWAGYALDHGFYGYGGIDPLVRNHPNASPGMIVNMCQGAYTDLVAGASYYDQYDSTALAVVQEVAPGTGKSLVGPNNPNAPTLGSITEPDVANYDPSPFIRNSTGQLGQHGRRAFGNARTLLVYARGVRYVSTGGPQ